VSRKYIVFLTFIVLIGVILVSNYYTPSGVIPPPNGSVLPNNTEPALISVHLFLNSTTNQNDASDALHYDVFVTPVARPGAVLTGNGTITINVKGQVKAIAVIPSTFLNDTISNMFFGEAITLSELKVWTPNPGNYTATLNATVTVFASLGGRIENMTVKQSRDISYEIVGNKVTLMMKVPSKAYPDLQSAIDAVPKGQSADIHILRGTYILPSTNPQITLKSNLRIHGDGIGKTILKRSATLRDNFDYDMMSNPDGVDLENVTIEDLTLDGMYPSDPLNYGGGCIVLSHNQVTVNEDIIVRRVEAKNANKGVGGRNFIGESWDDPGLTIEDCKIHNCWSLVSVINGEYVKILNNDLRHTTSLAISGRTGGDAIYTEATSVYLPEGQDGSCHHWIITGNYITDIGDTGLDITTSPATGNAPYTTDIVMMNNTLVGASVRINYADGVVFQNNVIKGSKTSILGRFKGGISVDFGSQGPSRNVKINDNNLEPSPGRTDVIDLEETYNIECVGNTFYLPYVITTPITQIFLGGDVKISNNTFINSPMPSSLYKAP